MSVSSTRVLPVCRSCYIFFEQRMNNAVPRITSVGGSVCPWCKTESVDGLFFAPLSGKRGGLVSGDRLRELEG